MSTAKNNNLIIFILTLGVFSILNTEMGVVGILPMLAEYYGVSISDAGLFVSLFALAVAISGPIMPLVLSGVNRKRLMILVLAVFLVGSVIQAVTTSFEFALVARTIQGVFHPVFVSLALSVAAQTSEPKDVPRAVSRVMMGVSGGMVLGVPVVSFIASTFSLFAGMMVFVVVTGAVLVAVCVFVPPMEVRERLTYGEQIRVLRLPLMWVSLVAVVLLNGAVYGVYSFFAEYLGDVAGVPVQMISAILLGYGLANVVGNEVGGRALSRNAAGTVFVYPLALAVIFVALLVLGGLTVPVALVTIVWGVLVGAGANINQYIITSAAPRAHDFANGLFLATTNLGTTLATSVCGAMIAAVGTGSIVWGGLLFLAGGFACVLLRRQLVVKQR